MAPQGAQLVDPRTTRRLANAPALDAETPAPAAAAPRATAGPSTTTTQLPDAVASRLDELLARDPGLAEAVSAQLPAARADATRALAGYATPTQTPHVLDISG